MNGLVVDATQTSFAIPFPTSSVEPTLTKVSFPKTLRLRRKSEFDRVFRERVTRRHSCQLFAMLVCPNQLNHPRLGLAIAARVVPTAVERNRIKRLIRESFRAHQAHLPAADIVLNARAGASLASNVNIVNRLEEHWRVAVRLCVRS